MPGRIVSYIDCVSPYSYFALLYLEANRIALQSHGVDIDIVPVFLGGINVGSGNKPPWTLPAKANYSSFDSARAKKFFNVPDIQTPSFFPILSLLPQRALTFIKSRHPQAFIPTLLSIFSAMWQDQCDVSKPDILSKVLSKHLPSPEVREILEAANNAECKKMLSDKTQEALDHGAFGCPWFWVRNGKGAEEPFFGSDRFHYMWEFLDLPCRHLELLPREKARM